MAKTQQSIRLRAIVPLLLAALLALFLVACRSAANPVAQPPLRPAIEAPLELFAQPDTGPAPLIEALDSAQESVRLKMYLLSQQEMIEALKRTAARGVDTRLLLEMEPFGGGESNRQAADELRAAGVQVKSSPAAFQYSHEKSLVVDDQLAFILTQNLTNSSFNRNREYGVVVQEQALVDEIAAVFDADWERLEPPLADARLVWSPINSRQRLQSLIDSAQVSLELEQTSVLDQQVIDWLIEAAQRSVRVRLITPAVFGPDEWEFEPLSRLLANGVAVRFLDEPYVHAKTILADGQRAFVGSQNFSATSLDLNRELGIIFDDAAAVNRLASYFLQDWNIAQPWGGPQPTATLPPSGIVSWQEAAGYAGQTVTVEGDIIDAYNSGSVVFLNFSRNREDFTLVIFSDDVGRFPEPPEELYLQKRVRVTGQVKLYQERPEIVVEEPSQIQIVADLAPAQSAEPTATLPASGVVDWQEAASYVGQDVVVEGEIVRTYNSGQAVFLNFAENYQDTFTVVIFAGDFAKWPQPPDQVYQGQRVQVSGRVKEYQGAPEIVVEDPAQIDILGLAQSAAAATPTPLPLIPWEEAAAHEGEQVTIQGAVVDTYNSGQVIFLNFSRNREDFKVVIFKRTWSRWPQPPDELYQGKTIRVSGQIVLYEGVPEIIVEGPSQIEVVE